MLYFIYFYPYVITILCFMAGMYMVIAERHLLKKLFGLAILQTAALLFYITMAKLHKGQPPVLQCLQFEVCPTAYSNPLPHVLMLTAIVVGVGTLSVGLAMLKRIYSEYGTLHEDEIYQSEAK